MSKVNIVKKIGKVASIAAAAAPIVQIISPAAKYAANTVENQFSKKMEEQKELISVPELYKKGFTMTKEQAIEELNREGLNYTLIPLTLNEAKAKYCNCFDNQVIATYPKAKSKIKAGNTVKIKYITQEVIDKSQQIFDEAETQKALKRTERKQKISDVINKTKQKTSNLSNKNKKENPKKQLSGEND